jgi:hypothetical protein
MERDTILLGGILLEITVHRLFSCVVLLVIVSARVVLRQGGASGR